jgi:hypothetical protein
MSFHCFCKGREWNEREQKNKATHALVVAVPEGGDANVKGDAEPERGGEDRGHVDTVPLHERVVEEVGELYASVRHDGVGIARRRRTPGMVDDMVGRGGERG